MLESLRFNIQVSPELHGIIIDTKNTKLISLQKYVTKSLTMSLKLKTSLTYITYTTRDNTAEFMNGMKSQHELWQISRVDAAGS